MLPLPLRFQSIDPSDRSGDLPVVKGCRADYLALKAHHYRPGDPRAVTRVLAIRDNTPTATDRFLAQPVSPSPVAVLVESLPTLSCRLRDEALGGRYGHLRPKPRSVLLNQELRCISRVIVDPRYRGLGLAVRLVRHALANATTRYTEALAVMGRVSPFFEHAGMIAYERPALAAEQRALAALRYAGIEPNELAMPSLVQQRIQAMHEPGRQLLIQELTRWYRTGGGRGAPKQPVLPEVIACAQRNLFASPIYYLQENTHVQIKSAANADPTDRSTRRAPRQQQRDAQGPAR